MSIEVKELEEVITKRTERRIIIEERIKKHFKDNINKYKVIGLALAVIGTAAVAIAVAVNEQNKSDGNTPKIPPGGPKVKSDTSPHIPLLGRRGDGIHNLTTGEDYGSRNQAIEALDTTPWMLNKHLNGDKIDINGNILQLLGENLTPAIDRPSM